MTDISNKTVTVLLLLVLAVVIVGTSISVSELSRMGARVASVTGAVTESGTTSVNVAGTASLAVAGPLDFGSGYVATNTSQAVLTSNEAEFPNSWVNTSPQRPGNFTVTNNGTTILVLNVSVQNRGNAEVWLGGVLNSVNASLEIRGVNLEPNSCTANGNIQSGFFHLLNQTHNHSIYVCDELDYTDASDSIGVLARVTVPNDARAGNRSVILNFEGTAAT